MLLYKLSRPFLFLLQIDPANFEGLKSRLEQKDKEICALKQAAKVRHQYTLGKNSKFALTLKSQKTQKHGEITSLNYILKL